MNKRVAAAAVSGLALCAIPFIASNADAVTSPTTTHNGVVIDNNATHWSRGDVKVVSTTKPGKYALVSYKILSHGQVRTDLSTKYVGGNGAVSFHVHVAGCDSQIDLVRGTDVPSTLPENPTYFTRAGTLIDSLHNTKTGPCEVVVTPTPTVPPSETPTPTETPTETPSETPTQTVTETPSEPPTVTPSVIPSETPSVSATPTVTESSQPSETPTVPATVLPTPTTPATVVPRGTPEGPGADDSTPTPTSTNRTIVPPVKPSVKPSSTPKATVKTTPKATQKPVATVETPPAATTKTLAHTGFNADLYAIFGAMLIALGLGSRKIAALVRKD